MKKLQLFIILALSVQFTFSQKIMMDKAPKNPIGYKHKKEHFFLKGDIYSSEAKIFDRNGNLISHFGTRYYYNNDGQITDNNYGDNFKYDNNGNIIEWTTRRGKVDTYSFNSKNLLAYVKNSNEKERTHTYDSQDRLIKTVIHKKGVFYQQQDFKYRKKNDTLIIDMQFLDSNKEIGFKGSHYYLNGSLVKESLRDTEIYYAIERDEKGNTIDFYRANEPNAKHYTTHNRYYSDVNKKMNLEFGYYTYNDTNEEEKYETVFINGEIAKDITISRGVKPNEKVVYDGLTETYYSVPNVIKDTHTIKTRLPINTTLSKGEPMISYTHDGKFINYIHGSHKVKSRDFNYLGDDMVDYRIDKYKAHTYIIYNYKDSKGQAVKPITLFTTNENSILYSRELIKNNFFVVIKGKHIDYQNVGLEYLANGEDALISINGKPLYVLTGFKSAKSNQIMEGKLYNGEPSKNTKPVVAKEEKTTSLNCVKGDCINGWGQIKQDVSVIDATFVNGNIDGVAYITYTSGSLYYGEYKNNFRHGFGAFVWGDTRTAYIGYWQNGQQHGHGMVLNKSGEIINAGIYENGKLVSNLATNFLAKKTTDKCLGDCVNGFGQYSYSNGDIYIGFFKNSQRYSLGTYYWHNKSIYTGAYSENGKRNGFGSFIYVDKSIYRGIFVDDKIQGLGNMKYAETGTISLGVFNNKGSKIKDY